MPSVREACPKHHQQLAAERQCMGVALAGRASGARAFPATLSARSTLSRLFPIAFALAATACADTAPRSEPVQAAPESPGGPSSAPAFASASSSPAPTPAPADTVVRTPVPTTPPTPIAALDAYLKEVDARCPERDGVTTQGMVEAAASAMDCRALVMDQDAAALGTSIMGVFLDADPKGPTARDRRVPSLWSKTTDAACRVELAQATYQGAERYSGAFERVAATHCAAGADRQLGFLMRTRARGVASDAVIYVRNNAASRVAPRPRLALWQRYAAVARTTAPHYAVSRCRLLCRLSDADWIDLEADIASTLEGADRLGAALCAAWPELATAFGSAATCAQEIADLWLPSGASALMGSDADFEAVSDPAPSAGPVAPDPKVAPPADPAYEAALHELRLGWARTRDAEQGAVEQLVRLVADPRMTERGALRTWMTDFASFRDRLSIIDSVRELFDVSRDVSSWTRPAVPNEGPTARLLEGYLVELILRGATTDLTAHVRAREAWGLAVEKNLRAARAILEKPCVGTDSFCGAPSPSTDAAARERIDGLLDAGPKLGASLCDAAPELSAALGAADCARVATAYLFSMADKIGEPAR